MAARHLGTKQFWGGRSLKRVDEMACRVADWIERHGAAAMVVSPLALDYAARGPEDVTPAGQGSLLLRLAAVDAGLGTLGLNTMLLTPEYGPRVLLTAVLCSVDVDCDRPLTQALCRGPSCGRCLKACPGDTVRHWGRDWETCDEYRSPYGFAKLTGQIEKIVQADDAQTRKELLRSEATFNLWQSILRGSGVITGCRRCADVCPVGADYESMLADAMDEIPENTPQKEQRLVFMQQDPASGAYAPQQRWIGILKKA